VDLASFIWSLFPVAISTAVIVGIGMWMAKNRASNLRNPALEARYVSAGFQVSASRLGAPVVCGTLHGTPFELTATPVAKGTPAKTVVSVPAAPGADFEITREGSRDLSGRNHVEAMFPDAKARNAVLALFSFGFDTVARRGAHLSATRHLKAEVLHPDALSAAVEQLAVLRSLGGPPAG
jgi:hypothetical protein